MPTVLSETCEPCNRLASNSLRKKRASLYVLFLPLFGLLLTLAACDSASDVGSDLLGDETAEPIRVRLLPTNVVTEKIGKSTGAVRGDLAFSGAVSAFLAGTVDDPLMGSREAAGYIDFKRASFPDGFEEEPLTFVELRLTMPYAYGDTTVQNELALYEVASAWDPTDADASDTYPAGELVANVNYSPSDTAIVLRMSDDWIQSRSDVLLNTDFNSLFHGFELRPVTSTAVVGFSANSSGLYVANEVDTLEYVPERIFTHLTENVTVEPPLGMYPVVDGFGTAIRLDFDFDAATSGLSTLSRVTFRVPSETDLLTTDSLSGYVRPQLQQLFLYGVNPDGMRTLLGSAFPDEDDNFVFIGATASSEESVLGRFQSALMGEGNIDHFVLAAPPTLMTISPLLVPTAGSDDIPEIILTLVPVL